MAQIRQADSREPEGRPIDALGEAEAVLRKRIPDDRWQGLHKWTRSCLVTSQLFSQLLEEVDRPRQELLKKHGDAGSAPEVDFSPVVLSLFKAVEIEIERQILRDFRDSADRVAFEEATHDPDLKGLIRYLQRDGTRLGLGSIAGLFSRLGGLEPQGSRTLNGLKGWMRQNLAAPHLWWGRRDLAGLLKRFVEKYRNPAAHTGRLSPLEARTTANELWGNKGRPGVLPLAFRALERLPSPGTDTNGFTIKKVLLHRRGHWLLKAEDNLGESFHLSLVPGEFEAVKPAKEAFLLRRSITHEHLAKLVGWYQASLTPGRHLLIISQTPGRSLLRRGQGGWKACGPVEGADLALALAGAAAALHAAGLVHGHLSPHCVFLDDQGRWTLGGQALLLLTERNIPVCDHPRTVAPEVDPRTPLTRTPAGDVFSIAATVCCLRQGPRRATAPPQPEDVAALFPEAPAVAKALARALQKNPAERQTDATALLRELGGAPDLEPAAETPAFPVMISYSRADEAEAISLVAQLQARGIAVWRDKPGIHTGEDWRDRIGSAIDSCLVVLLLVSAHSNKSEEVPKELAMAEALKKPILPVLLDGSGIKGRLFYHLVEKQYLSLFEGDREENLDRLLQALEAFGVRPVGHALKDR
jgi:hypothetical protein